MQIPTIKVKIAGHDGPVIINEADFDPKLHSRLGDEAPEPSADPFDHDGDGKPGGSLPAAARPKSSRGARKRKGKAK
jgi:hypothetical protein